MKQFNRYVFSLLLLGFTLSAFGQFGPEGERTVMTKAEIDKRYQENIKKSKIDGVYIPVDSADAINEIIALAPEDGLSQFAAIEDEEEAARKLYFGLGRWMGVNWSFYDGSRLSHNLKERGIVHPDDMIIFLLTILHRDLNGITSDNRDIIDALIKKRKEIARETIDKVISTEIKRK